MVNHNHEKFCQKYNLTSPRSDEDMPIKRLDSGKRLSPKQILPPIDLTKAGYQPLDAPNSKSKFIVAENETHNGLVPRPPQGQPKSGKSKKSKTKKLKCQ